MKRYGTGRSKNVSRARPLPLPDLPDLPVTSLLFLLLLLLLGAPACRDLTRFSTTKGDRFEGNVVPSDFVRAGMGDSTRLCLSIDADHLQDTPGTVSTNDGRFQAAALRPIPQLWHDPLSTFEFGEGRVKNLIYAVTPSPDGGVDAGDSSDVLLFVSLMESGSIEVRMVRGAPPAPALFAVFTLDRQSGPCSF
jgi:hypothetical protein